MTQYNHNHNQDDDFDAPIFNEDYDGTSAPECGIFPIIKIQKAPTLKEIAIATSKDIAEKAFALFVVSFLFAMAYACLVWLGAMR
jgi:hypothetical protein